MNFLKILYHFKELEFRLFLILMFFMTKLPATLVVIPGHSSENEPRHEKCCLPGLRPGETQTSLLSYRDKLEAWNFGFSKYRYYTIYVANNKGADQIARMRRLICTFVVRIVPKTGFLMTWLK